MVTKADSPQLLDVMTRHQIYLESVKIQQGERFNEVVKQLRRDLREIFFELEVSDLRKLTRRELERFIKLLVAAQIKHFNTFTELVLIDLRKFMEVDTRLNAEIMKETQQNETKKDKAALAAVLALAAKPNKIWGNIINAPIQANGILPEKFLERFTNSASFSIESLIRKAWANSMTTSAALALLLGTSRLNNRDAQLARFALQANALTATLLQHAAGIVQAAVASNYFDKYRWVSILDSKTTEICRSRDGKVYSYGEGPLPPAHVNCRSKTEPIDGGEADIDESYAAWLNRQPKDVREDIASVGKSPLTLEEFAAKLKFILAV